MDNYTKAYAVITYGGRWDDSWESIAGICTTQEQAELLKEEVDKVYTSECTISEDLWNDMCNTLMQQEVENGVLSEDIPEALHKLFPDYSLEDYQVAEKTYEEDREYIGTMITEVKLFNGN